jgi:electron-transferring-flavoprotein dehydrogenase
MKEIDALIIGAGPAGLAAAIRLKQRLNKENKDHSVVVIDKGMKLGSHNLSGAIFEPRCLDELTPDWRNQKSYFCNNITTIEKDELYFLTKNTSHKIPSLMVPPLMNHKGDLSISISKLTEFLGQAAKTEGVEIYTGFSAEKLLLEGKRVKGVKLLDLGLDIDGKKKHNYLKGEEIYSKLTILADGSRGVLSLQLAEVLGGHLNPQVYSVGIKQLLSLPADNNFGPSRSIHTLGYPNKPDIFGGGFVYSMNDNLVVAGLILGLDWKYGDLNPHTEFEVFKSHPLITGLLRNGKVISTGAKTIPEGGYYSLGRLYTDGALVVGDAAGFVNMEKIKGIHCAVLSGIGAADAAFDALSKNDMSAEFLSVYKTNLENSGLMKEMRHARNFRQCFRWGVHLGAPLSKIQHLIPFKLGIEEDYTAAKAGARINRKNPGMEQETFIGLSGVMHEEDEKSHVSILDPSLCDKCEINYKSSCTHFCPGQVYRRSGDKIILSPSNCFHCGTCVVKCPYQTIRWQPPEGGEGPHYKQM